MDIKRLMRDYDLQTKDIAAALFPDNKLPEKALRRVWKGELPINEDQIRTLARICGTKPGEILEKY